MAENNKYRVIGKTASGFEIRLPDAGRTENTSSRTYELNTGSKTYTLSQKQYDGLRQIYKSTWADAYAFDDEDQQRKAAGLVPRSYAQNYKNNNLDNWLLENKLPSTKYLDKYLEAYDQYETERKEYESKAQQKNDLYAAAAVSSVDLELKGIYNDDKMYNWTDADGNDILMSGKDIHENAFFDALNSGQYGDFSGRYVFDDSDIEKTEADFESAADWREYQLKQSQKAFDLQKDWDDATSISYDDYLKNYKDAYDKQIKAQKIVGDAMGRTWVEYAEDQATDREKAAYGALTTDAALDEFISGNQDAPADVIAKMYEYGVDQGKIKRAKNQFVKKAATDEDKKAILDAFTSGKQARKEAEQQARERQQTAKDGVRDIFNKTVKYDGGGADADSLTQAVEAAREAGYSAEDIASAAADLRRELAQGGMLNLAANGVLRDAVHPERKANADADAVVKSVQDSYAQSTTELSPVSAEQAASLILSNLEYQGNRVTDESVQAGMDAAIASGASYAVLREAADMALNQLNRGGTADNGGSRIPGAYTGDFTTSEIMNNALASAKQEDEALLAREVRNALVVKGYTDFEIDQAFRRNGWSGLLNDEDAARDYFIEVAMPRDIEADPDGWKEALGDLTPEQYATLYWDNMTDDERAEYVASFKESAGYNTDLHRTHGEQAIAQFAMIVPRVITGIASGAVNLADMAEGLVSGRTDRWEASKWVSEANAFTQNLGRSVNQDVASDFIAGANDIATEVLRMYVLSGIGSGLAKPFAGATAKIGAAGSAAATNASSKALSAIIKYGTNAITHLPNSAPFMLTAIGNGYAEAMDNGATPAEATVYGFVTGTLEGALESFNVDGLWGKVLGGNRLAKQLLSGGKQAFRSVTTKARLLSLVTGFLGEFTEESASYAVSVAMQRATYDKDAQLDLGELFEQGFMGGLVGLFGSAASLSSVNPASIMADYIVQNKDFSPTNLDLLDAFIRVSAMTDDQVASLSVSGTVLSSYDFNVQAKNVATAQRNLENAKQKHDKRLSELDSEQKRLSQELARCKADRDAARNKWRKIANDAANAQRKESAFKAWEKAKSAAQIARNNLAEFENKLPGRQQAAETDYNISVDQNTAILSAAQTVLNGHYVKMTELFGEDVNRIARAAKAEAAHADARRRYDASAARIDAMMDADVIDPDAYDSAIAEMASAADDRTGTDVSSETSLAETNATVEQKMHNVRAGKTADSEAKMDAQDSVSQPSSTNTSADAQTANQSQSITEYVDVDASEQRDTVALGERLGVKVVFEAMSDGDNGWYGDGEIHINTRLPKGETAAMIVFRHELTHYIEGSDEYTDFSDFVIRYSRRLGMDVVAAMRDIESEYASRGKPLKPGGARKEFVAKFAQENLLRNPAAIDALVREQSGAAGRVLNWIQYNIAKLKLRGQNTAEARGMLEAERMFVKAFAKAGKRPSDGVRQYSVVKDAKYDYRVIADRGVSADMSVDEQLAAVKSIINDLRGKSFTSLIDGEKLSIASRNKTAQKLYRPGLSMKGNKYATRLSVTSMTDEAIAASRSAENPASVSEEHSGYKATSRGGRSVLVEIPTFDSDGKLIGADVYHVSMVTLGNEDGQIVYDFNRINKTTDSHSDLLRLKNQGLDIDRESIKGIVSENLPVVNPQIDENKQHSTGTATWSDYFGGSRIGNAMQAAQDAQYAAAVARGDTDTMQRMVDDQANKKLKDSKARDENGRLIKFYTGTDKGPYTVADSSFSDDGISLFAADSTALAETYTHDPLGNPLRDEKGIFAEYLDARNPLVIENESMTGWHNMLATKQPEIVRFSIYEPDSDGVYRVDLNGEEQFDLTDPNEILTLLEDKYDIVVPVDVQAAMEAEWLETFDDEEPDLDKEMEYIERESRGEIPPVLSFAYAIDVRNGESIYVGGKLDNDSLDADVLSDYEEDVLDSSQLSKTRNYAKWAYLHGYDSVIFTHLLDPGGLGKPSDSEADKMRAQIAHAKTVKRGGDTVAVVFDSEQIKSADAETYDDDGNLIPLSQRFDTTQKDMRWSTGMTWDEMVKKYGAKDAGMQPRARDMKTPERADDTRRVSDFIRSFVESDKATRETIEAVKDGVENGELGVYTPLSNKALNNRARNTIAMQGTYSSVRAFAQDVENGSINKDTGAIGVQLLADAAKRGDDDGVMQILSSMCVYATETGRATQALSMLKKTGGIGSAYYMRTLEKRLNAKYKKQIADGKMLPISVDKELLLQLAKAKTLGEIEVLEDKISQDISNQLPLSLQQKMSNWRYFSMLANPTTHARNLAGNGLMAGVRGMKDVVATGIERAFVRNESDRTHAVYSKRAQTDRVAYAEASYKAHERDLTSGGKYGFDMFMKKNQRLFDNKALNKAAQFNFDALEREDAFFLERAYKNAMVQYLVAQNLDPANLTPQQEATAVQWAILEAQRATFRDASTLASYLNKFSNMNAGTKVLMEGVMPFKKTPINIAKRGIEYSPIGIIEGVYQLTAGVKNGKYTVAQGIDRLSAGLTGTGLMALGALLAKWGILRGSGEEDEKYESFLGASGEQGYSLNIGDVSIDISGLAPATIPLFMGVSFMEAVSKEEAFDMSMLVDTLTSVADPLMEMSFMSSLNAALESYSQDGVGGALGSVAWNAASSYAAQYVPTFTGKIGQFADPTTRTTKSDATSVLGGTMDSFLRSVVKKVPGAEATLESYVDVWGREQEKTTWQEWALDFFNKFVSPANVKVKNRDAVDNELIRLVEATGETGFLPSTGRKYFTVDGERYTMDAKQYTAYSMELGQAIYAAVKRVMNTSGYRAADDAKKAKLLEKAVDNATTTVNDKYKELLGAFDR